MTHFRTFAVVVTLSAAAHADLYVARDGNDAWTGRLPAPNADRTDGPLATLEAARDAVRKQRPLAGPVTVHLRGGEYFRDKPFELTAADSGTTDAPITYHAYNDEPVRLIGGRRVTRFAPLAPDDEPKRIDPAARDHVRVADLKTHGIADLSRIVIRGFGQGGQPAGLELFFADQPMTLARWPNEGFTKIADVTGEKSHTVHGIPGDAVGKFLYDGDRPARWTAEDDLWLHGYWFWDWADAYQKVESIDPVKRLVTLAKPYHGYGYRKGARYYAFNALSELDAPGEWYLDRKTSRLYFWPPAPIDSADAYVSLIDTLVTAKDAAHVTIRGLTLEVCRGTAVRVDAGSHVRIADCVIRNTGNGAVAVQGGSDHSVAGCDLYNLGEEGIALVGGNRETLTPARHEAVDNHIHHYARVIFTYMTAIRVAGVGNRVAHNLIHDAPHMAIGLAGNDHLIERNEIHHVCLETDDAGAFYMGRDWTQRGNVIRHNYFHDLGTYKTNVGVQSVYLDDWSSGTTVFGNVIVRGGRGVLVGGGRDNIIENNLFVDCTPAVHVDSRGLGWAKYYFDGSENTLTQRLNAVPYKTPPWSDRYPQLLTLYQDEPALAKGNVITRNICVGGRWLDLQNGLTDKVVRIEDNLVDPDPHFVDRAAGDYRLRDDSPAYKLGFKPIPFDKIGLTNRDRRPSQRLRPDHAR